MLVRAADTADELALEVLSCVYDAVASNADDATRALPPVETARQLIRAFKVASGGGGVSVGIPGGPSVGANLSRARTYVTPATARPLGLAPRLLTELAGVACLSLGAGSVLVHLDNLENVTDEAADVVGRGAAAPRRRTRSRARPAWSTADAPPRQPPPSRRFYRPPRRPGR